MKHITDKAKEAKAKADELKAAVDDVKETKDAAKEAKQEVKDLIPKMSFKEAWKTFKQYPQVLQLSQHRPLTSPPLTSHV